MISHPCSMLLWVFLAFWWFLTRKLHQSLEQSWSLIQQLLLVRDVRKFLIRICLPIPLHLFDFNCRPPFRFIHYLFAELLLRLVQGPLQGTDVPDRVLREPTEHLDQQLFEDLAGTAVGMLATRDELW